MSTVKSIALHAEDLDDGRILLPGETASSVDLKQPHNKLLVEEGKIAEVPAKKTTRSKGDS